MLRESSVIAASMTVVATPGGQSRAYLLDGNSVPLDVNSEAFSTCEVIVQNRHVELTSSSALHVSDVALTTA